MNFARKAITISVVIFALAGVFLIGGYAATRFGLTDTQGTVDIQREAFLASSTDTGKTYTTFPLAHTEEWIAFRLAVAKDKPILDKVSAETGVPTRLLISLLVPEQMRLFYSERALFKEVFSPLKILGSQSQFSWGIFGIKDDTARAIENHLQDTQSPYYLGPSFEKSLDFKTNDRDQERFARIIDEHDRTYAYVYAALYVAQIQSQWEKAGFPINNRPDIIATLWNLGFEKSSPKANPQSGGSIMEIHGTTYSFGKLAHDFYYSDEMIELFP